MGFFDIFRRNRHERTGYELYTAAVAASRDPFFYLELGVPDTLDGRFDMTGLYAYLLIHRLSALPAPGPALSQAVFDAMFNDMDVNLRELGVGDMSVGKKVRAMWEAFHGRAAAYQTPLETGDHAGLATALARNVWRGTGLGDPASLARISLAQSAHLARQELARLQEGQVEFLPARQAAEALATP